MWHKWSYDSLFLSHSGVTFCQGKGRPDKFPRLPSSVFERKNTRPSRNRQIPQTSALGVTSRECQHKSDKVSVMMRDTCHFLIWPTHKMMCPLSWLWDTCHHFVEPTQKVCHHYLLLRHNFNKVTFSTRDFGTHIEVSGTHIEVSHQASQALVSQNGVSVPRGHRRFFLRLLTFVL